MKNKTLIGTLSATLATIAALALSSQIKKLNDDSELRSMKERAILAKAEIEKTERWKKLNKQKQNYYERFAAGGTSKQLER